MNPVTEATFNGTRFECVVPESQMPESPQPWFEMTWDGVAYVGQAIAPPTPTEDGRLRYVVEVMEKR